MTDDLVKRLRSPTEHEAWLFSVPYQAADRIEALDAEMKLVMEINERLLAALRKIGEGDVCVSLMTHPAQCGRAYQARAALAGEKKHEP